jgi:hypothetical protein
MSGRQFPPDGTGSKPPAFHGLQRSRRQTVKPTPLIAPCRSMDLSPYSEQLGWNRQLGMSSFDKVSWYPLMMMMSSHFRIQPAECSHNQFTLPRAANTALPRPLIARVSRPRSRALRQALGRAFDSMPRLPRVVPAPRWCSRSAGGSAVRAFPPVNGGPLGGGQQTRPRPCQPTARHGSTQTVRKGAATHGLPDRTLTRVSRGG